MTVYDRISIKQAAITSNNLQLDSLWRIYMVNQSNDLTLNGGKTQAIICNDLREDVIPLEMEDSAEY